MIQIRRNPDHKVDVIFILALLALFAATSFIVVSIGARQYHSIADQMSTNYETRTCTSYLEEKLNQNDSAENISLITLSDSENSNESVDALALTSVIDKETYVTYVYYYDGYIREILTQEGNQQALSAGQKIIQAKNLEVTQVKDDLLKLDVTSSDGDSSTIYAHQNAK